MKHNPIGSLIQMLLGIASGVQNMNKFLSLGIFIMLLTPIGVFADDVHNNVGPIVNIMAGENTTVGYYITNNVSDNYSSCNFGNGGNTGTLKIIIPSDVDITANATTLKFTGCDKTQYVRFMSNGSTVPADYPIMVSISGGKTTNGSKSVTNTTDSASFILNVAPFVDDVAPIITMRGISPIDVMQGSIYSDEGATALDQPGNINLTSSIITTNLVDTAIVGIYTVTYDVTDAAGNNASEVVRTVNVKEAGSPLSLVAPADIGPIEATGNKTPVSLGNPVVSGNTSPVINDAPDGFKVGTTIVTWTATNDSVTITSVQNVTIVDTVAPIISSHANISENSAFPIAVIYTVPVTTDLVDGTGVASCLPTSGATFAIGITIVTCNATDAHGNEAISTNFSVTINNNLAGKFGRIVLTFDDGYKSNAQNAMPVLKANHQKGVAFVDMTDIINAEENPGYYTDYMTFADLASINSEGWDISSHSWNHCCINDNNYLLTDNNSIIYQELISSKDWLNSKGYGRSSMFFAYPWGTYNDVLISNLEKSGYIAARTVDTNGEFNPTYKSYTAPAMNMTTQMDGPFTMPDGTELLYIPSGEVIKLINDAISYNGTLILTFHNVVPAPRPLPDGEYDYPLSEFENISNYLAALNTSGNAKVETLSEYFNVPDVIVPYTPPMPVSSTINMTNRTIMFSWTDGINGTGIKTDNFDVTSGGITTYLVTNRSFNVSALPGQNVEISVVAVNTTWGTRSLSAPLNINATIPSYVPSTPIGIMSTFGSTWVKTVWNENPVGNKTTSYDILVTTPSGPTWTNGTINTSVNVTGLSAGQNVTVDVYAMNDTTMSIVPAELSTTIPVTDIPIVTLINQSSKLFTVDLKYQAGLNTDSVEITTVRNFVNGTQTTSVESVPMLSGESGELVMNVTPHETVNFTLRGLNLTTGLYSINAYANQTLDNNVVVLSVDAVYSITQGALFRMTPVIDNIDNDTIVFTADGLVDGSSINPSTGEFVFDTTSASSGMYKFSITANDSFGSISTVGFMLNVASSPVPTPDPTPLPTPVVTETPAPTATPEPTPVVTETPAPTATPEPTPVVTETPAPTATPEPTPVVTPTVEGTTIGLYQSSTGTFFLKNNNSEGVADLTIQYGPEGLMSLAGDYNGDKKDTIGVYNVDTGTFYLKNDNAAGEADITAQYGPGGNDFVPLIGDWNNNGTATIGVYQISTGTFFLKYDNTAGPADVTVQYGPGGKDFVPVVGDWDGDGTVTIGVYQTSTGTFFLKNANAAGAADVTVQYGPGGNEFVPTVGDWNGDGIVTIGIYQTNTGTFFLKNADAAGAADETVQYGPGGSAFAPLIGRWN
jgi:peptidoglycan/xylan/chitin deacetylase (PgdA/CDA1 family)